MHTDGDLTRANSGLAGLIAELRGSDFAIDRKKLVEILSYGEQLVPHLEALLREAIEKSPTLDLDSPQEDSDLFAVVHASYLLVQLQAEKSLDLVLELLAQKQAILDYWLHELVQDDIWEVIFHLGQNRLGKLEDFIVNQENNIFSRLAVGTTLVQLAIHFDSKRPPIVAILKKVLALEEEEPDFTGLLVSEILDFREPDLRSDIMRSLRKNEVWSGIITVEEVNRSLQNEKARRLRPLGIFERYQLLRKNPYIGKSAAGRKVELIQDLKIQIFSSAIGK